MANYSMSPYAISAAPRYQRAGERRPITDIDGNGLSFRPIIEGVLNGLTGDRPHVDVDDATRGLRLANVHDGAEFTYADLGVSRAGIEGTVYPTEGEPMGYFAGDYNESLVRSMFAYPRDGYEVFWMSERAGNTSALSGLGKRLLVALRAAAPDFTFSINPVVAWSAVMAWAEQVPVKELRFDAPRDGSSHVALANGATGDVRISIKPQGSMRLNRLIGQNGPDHGMVFGFLSDVPVVKDGLSADRLIRDGWEAAVAFETPSGHQRSFNVGAGETAPSLIYQVGPDQTGSRNPIRPEPRDFAEACSDFLNDIPEVSRHAPSVGSAILAHFPS